MAFCGYKYKYRLNMSHSIREENLAEGEHFHTLEITLYIQCMEETFLIYEELEKKLVEYFKPYEGSFLNFAAPFDEVMPTIENISYEFYHQVKEKLKKEGYQLSKLEMSETPSRLYTVTEYLDTGVLSPQTDETDEKLDNFIRLSMPYLNQIQEKQILSAKEAAQQQKRDNQKETTADNSVNESKESNTENIEEQTEQTAKNTGKKKLLIAFLTLAAFGMMSVTYCLYLKSRGDFPFGEEVYMVLGKVDYLCTQLKQGRLAPIYMENWYNGYQMFVTTPPFPYYLIACLQIVVGDLMNAYLLFIGIMIFTGACGWGLLGKKWGNPACGLIIGLLWILMPGLLPIFVSQGNPSFLCLLAMLGYLIFFVQKACENGKKAYIGVGVFIFCAVLCQSFEALLLLLGMSGYALVYSKHQGNIIYGFRTILSGMFGVAASCPWLYVAVKNGGWDNVSLVTHGYQVTVCIAVAAIGGICLGNRASRTTFAWALVLWGLAAISKLPFAQNIPMAKYLVNSWLLVPAVGCIMVAMIQWKSSRTFIMLCILGALSMAGVWQVKDWAFLVEPAASYEDNLHDLEENGLKEAVDITKNQLLYLEIDSNNSFLPYYASALGKKITSTYKLQGQDCKVEKNVLQMENALYNSYYEYVFDRAFEGGNDTIVIGKQNLFFHKESETKKLLEGAEKTGYELYKENHNFFMFQHTGMQECDIIKKGLKSSYKGIVIGRSASEATMLFPQFQEGTSENIEDYSLEELKQYDKVLLMGFTYTLKENAQDRIEELIKSGVQVYIDMSQAPIDPVNNQREFMDVSGQTVHFENRFHTLIYKETVKNADTFINTDTQWDTIYLDHLDEVSGYSWVGGKKLAFCGEKDGVYFIGMNLIYHGVERKDEQVISILSDFLGENPRELPKRELVNISISFDGSAIVIEAQDEHVNTTWAYQNTFHSEQTLEEEHHYLVAPQGVTTVRFAYSMTWIGMMIMVLGGGVIFLIWCLLTRIELEIDKASKNKAQKNSALNQ